MASPTSRSTSRSLRAAGMKRKRGSRSRMSFLIASASLSHRLILRASFLTFSSSRSNNASKSGRSNLTHSVTFDMCDCKVPNGDFLNNAAIDLIAPLPV